MITVYTVVQALTWETRRACEGDDLAVTFIEALAAHEEAVLQGLDGRD